MLVHHADARCQGGFRVAGRQALAEGLDVAAVGTVMTKKNRHQRRFAGAVFTEQREDFAFVQMQRDCVVGDQRAEALGDALKLEHRIHVRSSL